MTRVDYKRVIIFGFVFLVTLSAGRTAAQDKVDTLRSDFVYDDHHKRDPFWTLLGHRGTIVNYDKDIAAGDMVLEGVMAEPTGESIAIINGNIVKIGTKIGLFVVKEISVGTVILEKGEEIFTLKLKKEE